MMDAVRAELDTAHLVLYSSDLTILDHAAHHFGSSSVRKKKALLLEPQSPLCPLLVVLAVSDEVKARRCELSVSLPH